MAEDSEALREVLTGLRQVVTRMGMRVNRGKGVAEPLYPYERLPELMEEYSIVLEICFKNLDRRLDTLQRRLDSFERKASKR